jgi:hypothetical protein
VTKEGMLRKYEFFLKQLKNRNSFLKVLELGAGPDDNIGASIRMWKDYFGYEADIHVADIKPSAGSLKSEGFTVHIGDLGCESFVSKLAALEWDFVIDDASHLWCHQILSFRKLFPSLKNGGCFIMEDLCTSFGEYRPVFSMGLDMKDTVSYFLALSRACCQPHGVENDRALSLVYRLTKQDLNIVPYVHMIAWIGNSCIIIKR